MEEENVHLKNQVIERLIDIGELAADEGLDGPTGGKGLAVTELRGLHLDAHQCGQQEGTGGVGELGPLQVHPRGRSIQ